jgi:hypothetical protein
LVREALAGDPDGEVARASDVINLDKVLDAGPPPTVAITSHEPGTRSGKDLVTVAARIANRGKGIGRIEWRINGITAGVRTAPADVGAVYEASRQLALDPGENRIQVIAYERHNLLASLPAQTTIVYDGPADRTKPKLHILAIGINEYTGVRKLHGSIADAKAFAEKMAEAAAPLYGESYVQVTLALDGKATAAGLDRIVSQLARNIDPRDTFVFYAAGHGFSLDDGRFFMIPQDYPGGLTPESLQAHAIGQERLQDWIANRIRAKKGLILLDTCESGALTGGYTKSRTEGKATETAVGRLHEATGRPVLTAASPGKRAYENYKGHGVFTYAILEALRKKGDGNISVTELAEHVEKRVPELYAELRKSCFAVRGVAAADSCGAEQEEKTQSAHFGSTGEDFPLVARLP